MTDLNRSWFLWAFDMAMRDAVRVHGDAARLAAYEGRQSFDDMLPRGLVGVVRDSDGSREASETPLGGSTVGDSAGPEGIAQ